MSESPSLNIKITADGASALHALDGLVSALERIKSVASSGFSGVTTRIAKLQKAFATAIPDSTVSSYERMAAALERISKTGVPNFHNPNNGGLPGTGGPNLPGAAGGGPNLPGAKDSTTTEHTQDIVDAGEGARDAGRNADRAASGFKRLADAIRAAGDSGKKTDGLLKKLIKTIGRIALTRTIRAMLKAITEGVKTGIANVREYSEHIGSTFHKAMDSVNDATLKMKNSIGAALAPAIQALIPYVIQLVNWFIQLLNTVNQFVSLMTGASSWTRAIDVDASSLEETKKQAQGAGKAVKNLLADWDELNIIQSQGGSGSGGSSTKDDEKYVNMFEQVGVFDERIRKLVAWLKENMDSILAVAKLVGAALLGWKLHTMFTSAIGKLFIQVIGIAAAIYGVKRAYDALTDQFQNGINWENFTQLVEGAGIAVLGLTAAFGLKGLGIGLAGFGLAGIASSLYDIWKNGEASKEALDQLKLSLLAGGIGVSILTGSWVFGVAGAVAALAVSVYENKEKIVGYIQEHVNEISGLLDNAGNASIAVGMLLALSGVSIVGGLGMIAAGLAMKDIGASLPDAVSGDVDQTLKNISTIVGKDLLAIGALLVISGIGIKAGMFMLLGGAIALGYGQGEGEDFKSYITTAWGHIKDIVEPVSLGMFAVGAILALTGIGVGVGLRMMLLGLPGIAAGIASGTLLDDLLREWQAISDWAFPLAVGSFVLGAILALTGVGVGIGLTMMAAGAIGVAAEYFSGDLLGTLQKTWSDISGWALPLSVGSFVLGAILALTGVAIGPGLLMMAVGAVGGTAEQFLGGGDLLGSLMDMWNSISDWAFPLAVGSFVLGAVLALSGVAIVPGLAMMAAGAVGVTAEYFSGDLLGTLAQTWGEIESWAFPLSIASFTLGAILALSGVGILPGLLMMAAGAIGVATEAIVDGDLLGSLKTMWNSISSWAEPLSFGSFVLGAILAFTGVGVVPGLMMMAAGIPGTWSMLQSSDVLGEIQAAWEEIQKWSDLIGIGSVALGLILALTGVALVPGLIMIGAGIAATGGSIDWDALLKQLQNIWSSISGWWETTVQPLISAVATWVNDNFIKPVVEIFDGIEEGLRYAWGALTVWWESYVVIPVQNAVEWVSSNIITPVTEYFDTLHKDVKKELSAIKGYFISIWKQFIYPVVEWIDKNIIQPISGFFSALWGTVQGDENNNLATWWEELWYTHFGGVVNWIKENITDKIGGFFENLGRTVRRIFGWIFGLDNQYEEVFKEYDSYGDAFKGYHESYGEDSIEKPIAMSIAYVVDHNEGKNVELGSEMAKDMVTGLMKEFSLDAPNVMDMLRDAFGWSYEDILGMVDFSALSEEELGDIMESFESMGLEFDLDIDNASFAEPLPSADTSAFTSSINEAAAAVDQSVADIRASINSLDGLSFNFDVNGAGGKINVNFPVKFAASGGMFTAGEMFVAREAGPEMIGRIGNRSAVANNEQIVSGIAGGVAAGQEEQNALLRRQNDILLQLLNKRVTAEAVPSSEWGRFNKQSNEMYERNTGVRG